MFDNITFHPNPYLGYNTTFVSVSILCKFAMLPDVYILLSPQEEEVHSSSWGNRGKRLVAYSPKRLNPLSFILLVCLGNT